MMRVCYPRMGTYEAKLDREYVKRFVSCIHLGFRYNSSENVEFYLLAFLHL